MTRGQKNNLLRIICSASLFLAGVALTVFIPYAKYISLAFFAAAALLSGFDVLISAVNGIIHGHLLDENFLMSAGSIAAFILGEFPEGAAILILYQTGELFQSVAVGKSRNSIASLMSLCPDEARLESGETVDPSDVAVGDVILVLPGEKIPLDGVIIEGETTLDTSSLTGESMPREAVCGEAVASGCISLTAPVKIKVTKEFSESTVAKILELIETASIKKAKTENFVRRFAKIYTPAVVIAALLIATLPPLLSLGSFKTWILRAVMFIVVSCPCALVVSVPLSFFGALGAASKCGVLVKGSCYLEALADIDTVIFDKTGTLTKGEFAVCEVSPSKGVTREHLLATAALLEKYATHPIAKAIKAESLPLQLSKEPQYLSMAGLGVKATLEDRLLLAGNAELLLSHNIKTEITPDGFTAVHIADGDYLGYILLSDEIKPDAKAAVEALRLQGIKHTVMLSGDKESAAKRVADELSFDACYAELLPTDKVALAEKLKAEGRRIAYAGDGINDAPVLALSDVGIAMGALGSDAAIEAADIVIMNDDLSQIAEAVKISKKAVRICRQNITFSLVIKFSQLLLSLVGLGTVWMAVFADVGVLMLAIANSMRTLKK